MRLIVKKSKKLEGSIELPPNKSQSFRALIFASLASGISKITKPKESSDWTKVIEALITFGAKIDKRDSVYTVEGTGGKLQIPTNIIDCGNSGIALRFLMGLAAGCSGYTVFTGDDSLRFIRPTGPLIDGLNQLGVTVLSTKGDGHAPIIVKGPIKGGKATIDGQDSQTVSALLIAALQAENDSEIIVRNAGEKPWVNLTLNWLDRIGVNCLNTDSGFSHFIIKGGTRLKQFKVTIAKDWSSAFYPVVAALITPGSKLIIKDLDPNEPQGDKEVVDILKKMGAQIEMKFHQLIVRHSELTGRKIDCNNFVDQLPILTVAAAFAKGQTLLTNAQICRHKESDRINAMCLGLKKMGAEVIVRSDGLIINGGRKLRGTTINSFKDHRIIMSFTVAALQAKGTTIISDAEMINKTFAGFVSEMQNCGAYLKLEDI